MVVVIVCIYSIMCVQMVYMKYIYQCVYTYVCMCMYVSIYIQTNTYTHTYIILNMLHTYVYNIYQILSEEQVEISNAFSFCRGQFSRMIFVFQ